jgi:hypothetical protein
MPQHAATGPVTLTLHHSSRHARHYSLSHRGLHKLARANAFRRERSHSLRALPATYGPVDCPVEDAVDCDRLGGDVRAGLMTVVAVVAVVMVVVALVVVVAVEVPPRRVDRASPPPVVAAVLDERRGASAGGDGVVGVRRPAGVDEPWRAVEPPSKVVRSAAVASEWCTNSSAAVSAAPPMRNAVAVITITRLTRARSPRLTRPRSASAAEGTRPASRSRAR